MNYLFAKTKTNYICLIFTPFPGVRAFANNPEGLALALFSAYVDLHLDVQPHKKCVRIL